MNRFNELLDPKNVKFSEIAKSLNVNLSIIYDWVNMRSMPNFDNLLKLADYFGVSVDYLMGRTDDDSEYHTKSLNKFSDQIKKVLKQKGVTKYRLFKDCDLSNSFKVRWFNKQVKPNANNLLKIANYLNVSMDELMGRII